MSMHYNRDKRRAVYPWLAGVFLLCSAVVTAQSRKQLAGKILADTRLDSVCAMAERLLSRGFTAGDGYPQVWIRDLNTFIETSCKVYSVDSIRKYLLTFYALQQPDGEIVDGYVLKGHVSWNDPDIYTSVIDPGHVGFKNTVETDQETSLIQAFGKYIALTGDRAVLDERIGGLPVRERMARSMEYLLQNRYSEKYRLLTGATTQDWGDVQVEGGATVDIDTSTHWAVDVYDNAMFVLALNDLMRFSRGTAERRRWRRLRDLTVKSIRAYLWDRRHQKFIPHLYIKDSPFPPDFDENKIYYHGGTAVAIEADLLSRRETHAANKRMLQDMAASGAPSIGITMYPPYPEGIIRGKAAFKPFVYQDGGDWSWFGGRMIQQLIVHGFVKEAYAELQPMIERVIDNGKFYEWYSVDGKPRGSGDFRGSAGVLAKAIGMLHAWAKQHLVR